MSRAAPKTRIALVAAAGLFMLIGPGSAWAQVDEIMPPGSTVEGKTIGEWTAGFWNWALSFPAALPPLGDDPLTDLTGDHQGDGQSGPVWFMCAGGGSGFAPVTRTFPVPAGRHILVSLINVLGIPSGGEDPPTLCGLVGDFVDRVDSLTFSLDGVPVPQSELFNHREPSGPFDAVVILDNYLLEPPGSYPDSCADGYYVMLEPLSPGPHEITCGGTHTGAGLSVDVTNNIVVSEFIPALPLLGACAFCAILLATAFAVFRGRNGQRPPS